MANGKSAISVSPMALPPLAPTGPLLPPLLVLRRRAAAARAVRPFANTIEDVDEAEIDLAQLEVHADDLDLHLVAQPIHFLRVLAAQQVPALHEPVVIVAHRRDVDHALDEMLDELDEQAERRDAGDV